LRVFNALPYALVLSRQLVTSVGVPVSRSLPQQKGSNVSSTWGSSKERTGGRRNRVFAYDRYLVLLNEGLSPYDAD